MKDIKDSSEERWREINGTNGLYQISDHGRVMRREKIIYRKGKKPHLSKELIMKMPLAGAGYPSVLIGKKRFLVHRLVGEYFIPNPDNKPDINHLFGDKTDNYYKHLAWSTEKENINHAFDTGLNTHVQKNDKHRSKPVIQCCKFWNEKVGFPSVKEVERSLGFKSSCIFYAIKHKTSSYGHRWKYQ
jgi:hypothetical protein